MSNTCDICGIGLPVELSECSHHNKEKKLEWVSHNESLFIIGESSFEYVGPPDSPLSPFERVTSNDT